MEIPSFPASWAPSGSKKNSLNGVAKCNLLTLVARSNFLLSPIFFSELFFLNSLLLCQKEGPEGFSVIHPLP